MRRVVAGPALVRSWPSSRSPGIRGGAGQAAEAAGAQPVGLGAGLDDVRVEGDPVNDCGDRPGSPNMLPHSSERKAGPDPDRGAFVPPDDDLEQQFGAARVDLHVTGSCRAAAGYGRAARGGRRCRTSSAGPVPRTGRRSWCDPRSLPPSRPGASRPSRSTWLTRSRLSRTPGWHDSAPKSRSERFVPVWLISSGMKPAASRGGSPRREGLGVLLTVGSSRLRRRPPGGRPRAGRQRRHG